MLPSSLGSVILCFSTKIHYCWTTEFNFGGDDDDAGGGSDVGVGIILKIQGLQRVRELKSPSTSNGSPFTLYKPLSNFEW